MKSILLNRLQAYVFVFVTLVTIGCVQPEPIEVGSESLTGDFGMWLPSGNGDFIAGSEPFEIERTFIPADESSEGRVLVATARSQEPTELVRALLRRRPSQEVVEFALTWTEGDVADLRQLQVLAIAERAARIEQRQQRVRSHASDVSAALLASGRAATLIEPIWLNNSVQLRASVADALYLIEAYPDTEVSLNAQLRPEWHGQTSRAQTNLGTVISIGLDGDPSGAGRYRIGIIEAQNDGANWPSLAPVTPATPAPIWRESSTDLTSRIQFVADCNTCVSWHPMFPPGFACIQYECQPTSARNTTTGHGDIVAWVAGGNITEGQDPTVTNSTDRAQRTGVATESVLDYYGVTDCAAVNRALQRAVERGVDVVNLSFRADFVLSPESACNAAYNCLGMNGAIQSATDAGVVVIKSAGNLGEFDPDCSLTYPAWRPEVISVGGIETYTSTSPTYSAAPMASTSSVGPVEIRYAYGVELPMAGLGLAAPSVWHCTPYTSGIPGYNCGSSRSGTSFAAPFVAGSAVLFAELLSTSGTISNARNLLVNLALMGDARGGSGEPAAMPTGISSKTGFGAIRLFAPTSAMMTPPWGWGTHTIGGGVGFTRMSVGSPGPETGTREWRWATMSFEGDLRNLETDYVLRVYDLCSPVSSRELVASDMSYDPRKRIQLSQAQLCVAGRPSCRCLEMEIQVYSAPASGVRIHSADFFHGGDPNAF